VVSVRQIFFSWLSIHPEKNFGWRRACKKKNAERVWRLKLKIKIKLKFIMRHHHHPIMRHHHPRIHR